MKSVFVDSSYFIAITNPRDGLYRAATDARNALGNIQLVTTDTVLTEFLNCFSAYGGNFRSKTVNSVHEIIKSSNIQIVTQSNALFLEGLKLYGLRLDKQYSMSDCISMVVMNENLITEVLTNDHHFEQEGFTILF